MDSPFSKDSSSMSEKVSLVGVICGVEFDRGEVYIDAFIFGSIDKELEFRCSERGTFAGSSGSSKRIEKVLPSELSLISVTSRTTPVSITCEESLEMICVKSSRLLPASWMVLSEL